MDDSKTKSLTYKELMEGDFPPPAPLVERLMVAGGGSVWSALWGTGKTWLALELARTVAAGATFLCHFPTKQGKVLYVDQEGVPGGHQERLRMLDGGRPLGGDLDIVFKYTSGLHLTDYDGFCTLDRWLTEEKPVLVILDSWVRFFRGKESDPVAVAALNDSLRSLRLTHGCATHALDHDRKPPLGGLTDRPEDRTRGTGEKLAGVDNGLSVEKARDERGVLLAYPIKSRWNGDVAPFRIAFETDPLERSARLCYRSDLSADDVAKKLGKSVLVAQAITALKEQWGDAAATVTTIQGYLEWSESVTRRVLTDMVKSGQLRTRQAESTGGRRGTVYDLAEGD